MTIHDDMTSCHACLRERRALAKRYAVITAQKYIQQYYRDGHKDDDPDIELVWTVLEIAEKHSREELAAARAAHTHVLHGAYARKESHL